MPLRARKSDYYLESWKSDNYRQRNEGMKQRNYTNNGVKKIKSNNFTRSNKEKFNIAVVILENSIIR